MTYIIQIAIIILATWAHDEPQTDVRSNWSDFKINQWWNNCIHTYQGIIWDIWADGRKFVHAEVWQQNISLSADMPQQLSLSLLRYVGMFNWSDYHCSLNSHIKIGRKKTINRNHFRLIFTPLRQQNRVTIYYCTHRGSILLLLCLVCRACLHRFLNKSEMERCVHSKCSR